MHGDRSLAVLLVRREEHVRLEEDDVGELRKELLQQPGPGDILEDIRRARPVRLERLDLVHRPVEERMAGDGRDRGVGDPPLLVGNADERLAFEDVVEGAEALQVCIQVDPAVRVQDLEPQNVRALHRRP